MQKYKNEIYFDDVSNKDNTLDVYFDDKEVGINVHNFHDSAYVNLSIGDALELAREILKRLDKNN